MSSVLITIRNIFNLAFSIIPPVFWMIAMPFVVIITLIKVVRSL